MGTQRSRNFAGPLSAHCIVRQATSLDVEIAGLYWHFVDIVWIIIFGVVYLVGAYGAEDRVLEAASLMGLRG